jgi:thiamine-phosphate pyrophosphorylase
MQSPIAGVYGLTPDGIDSDDLSAAVEAALVGGVRVIQYRNKTATPAQRLRHARTLRQLCSARAALIINDDVELAVAVRADGVHLGRDDATIADARARMGSRAIIGASCYDSLQRAAAAAAAGAAYIAFGSFFASSVKPDAVRAAPALIAQAKARWSLPVVAIGGITADNAAPLLTAGADAIAVVTALFAVADITAAARRLAALFATDTTPAPPISGQRAGTLPRI